MPYPFLALLSVIVFALVHLWASQIQRLSFDAQSRLFSAGGGLAIAYVFVDLLPKLCKNDRYVEEALKGVFPYFERHVFVMALAGFLLFFIVDRSHTLLHGKGSFWLTLLSYGGYNFLIGYAVVDKNDEEVQPLVLFTLAIALHYLTNDYSLNKEYWKDYQKFGKWILIACLFLGWLVGLEVTLSKTAVALLGAFIGGGVVMNVTRHELPAENPHSVGAFLFACVAYTCILLGLAD